VERVAHEFVFIDLDDLEGFFRLLLDTNKVAVGLLELVGGA